MKTTIERRQFLKRGMAAGSGVALFYGMGPASGTQAAGAVTNETMNTIHKLRTIHGNFSDKNISDEQIRQIIEASVRAANSSNMQTYSIIEVRDREKMQNVCGYAGSCMLVYCADDNRHHASARRLGHTYSSSSIVNFVTAGMNAMLAAQTAVIAAKSLGIDSLLTNGLHRGDMERVWKILDLPAEYCFPMISLVLGYPTEEPSEYKGRLDGPGVVHQETYHRLTDQELDAITGKYDDKSNHLTLNPDWDQQGFAHYQDWLYTAWLGGRSGSEPRESQMFKLLKRCGYIENQEPGTKN